MSDRDIRFSSKGWEDYLHWQDGDPAMLKRLNRLLHECQRTPFIGTGKPEPLRGALSGWWSRRLSGEHRLVYRPTDEGIVVLRCRFHY